MSESDESKAAAELRTAERLVEQHSAQFKKELGLRDLVLTQILFVVGLSWVGAAGKLGPSHIVFWLLAIVLFYIPSAMVVIYLNRLMPIEGGLYQWARLGFNNLTGFMVGWNLWLYVIVLTSEAGLAAAANLAYALGPRAAWMKDSKLFITGVSILLITSLAAVSARGLGVGKWIHNLGGVLILLAFTALLGLPYISLARGDIDHFNPFEIAMPTISLFSLNILGKMGFPALGGFEYVAILAGECKDPVRTISRSVIISAPIIALMFILGTSSVLAYLKPDQIDLVAPVPQVLSIGFKSLGWVAGIVPGVIMALLVIRLAQASVNFTGNTRLPMVAGWDRLLPAWFTKLHPKYKTPVNSVVFVAAMTLAVGLSGLIGVGQQESFQLLQSGAAMFYALTYLVMFAVPLIGLRNVEPRPSLLLRIACASGFLMTLLNVALSIFPIVKVESVVGFALRISSVIIGGNLLGFIIFLAGERRRRQGALAPIPVPEAG